MIRNKYIKMLFIAESLILIIFQGLLLGVAAPKSYYLIHDWMFYGINYVIIFFLCFLLHYTNNYFKWFQWILGLILIVINSTFFYYMGDVNVVVSKSENNQHEVLIKEYKKVNNETVRLERKGLIFGKQSVALEGSSAYKSIAEDTYKIDWVSGDTAVITYKASDDGFLLQRIYSFRSSYYVSYQYVASSLTGKWFEKNNPHNYFMYDKSEIVYVKDGQLYYYNENDMEQQDLFSLIVKGNDQKPPFTLVLNTDTVFEDDGSIRGTISISPMTLEESEWKVYDKH